MAERPSGFYLSVGECGRSQTNSHARRASANLTAGHPQVVFRTTAVGALLQAGPPGKFLSFIKLYHHPWNKRAGSRNQ